MKTLLAAAASTLLFAGIASAQEAPMQPNNLAPNVQTTKTVDVGMFDFRATSSIETRMDGGYSANIDWGQVRSGR